jgi:predicted Fe-S protein YdhL (DUF1289 family)
MMMAASGSHERAVPARTRPRHAEEACLMKTSNPCVSVCLFDGKTGWCRGCGCSLTELRQWKKMMPFHRGALERALAGRVRLLARDEAPSSESAVKPRKGARGNKSFVSAVSAVPGKTAK